MSLKSVSSVPVAHQSILMRVDFNVPLNEQGEVQDDFRIKQILPTIDYLLKKKAGKIILISHLGRPQKEDRGKKIYSLSGVAQHLGSLLQQKVYFFSDKIDSSLAEKIKQLPESSIVLLENIRFYPEEEMNDQSFAQQLANLGDIFVSDAFSVSQRTAASLCAITNLLPSYGGLLLEKEISSLDHFRENISSPSIMILGGAKIRDKINLIQKFISSLDSILLGGAVANTVFKNWGIEIGQSLVENDMMAISERLKKEKKKVILPLDFLVLTKDGGKEIRLLEKVENSDLVLDIGPETIQSFSSIIALAQTIFWNGPLGKFEDEKFSLGTKAIARAIFQNHTASAVIGGGDTIRALREVISEEEIIKSENIFLSTGGGAMLEYLANEPLPGLEGLKQKSV